MIKKIMPTQLKVAITQFGVRIGCHALRRCCLKAESTEHIEIKETGTNASNPCIKRVTREIVIAEHTDEDHSSIRIMILSAFTFWTVDFTILRGLWGLAEETSHPE